MALSRGKEISTELPAGTTDHCMAQKPSSAHFMRFLGSFVILCDLGRQMLGKVTGQPH